VDLAAELLVERFGKPAGPKEVSKTVEANLPIRDLETTTSTVDISDALSLEGALLDLDIPHTWRGDLVVKLTAPSGKEVLVHNRTGGSADDVRGTFDLSEALRGESARGTWTLSVEDRARRDTGTLRSWGLTLKGAPQGEATRQA
jgi:subtilisin-like proprotein convertase family protein